MINKDIANYNWILEEEQKVLEEAVYSACTDTLLYGKLQKPLEEYLQDARRKLLEGQGEA